MARKNKPDDFEDDGRVIADMNVEGMPWYDRAKKERGKSLSDAFPDMTKEQSRAYAGGVIAAALLVGGVFILGAVLFILFCIFVWFK